MFIKIETKDNEELTLEKEEKMKKEIKKLLEKHGYNVEVNSTASYFLIKEEVEYRSDNYTSFDMSRKLTKEEIDLVTDRVYDMDEIFSDLLSVVDEEIEKII